MRPPATGAAARGAVMIQGAGSNVGKSLLVAGLARALLRRGLSVAPFKPQNMSNNAAVTEDGGEIGRAQALQALACGLAPHTDMNPVLLKPETETGSQVVVQGRRLTSLRAADYASLRPKLLAPVLESFHRLRTAADIVLVEGAGSPAEINLRAGDIANMGFARAAGVPVILAGDIDRGGVIAQLVGTRAVLDEADAALIEGFIINKFRGDPSLFADGYRAIEDRCGWRGLGVVPWFADAARLPAEDAQDLFVPPSAAGAAPGGRRLRVGCLALSRIANFDDLDPLKLEPGVDLRLVAPGQAVPGDLDLLILPGSKSTMGDLAFLRAQGWDIDILAHHRRGGRLLGLCGGYQMLGCTIADPDGIEGPPGAVVQGLGLLQVDTVMSSDKRLSRVSGLHAATGTRLEGYEIHIGRTDGADRGRAFARIGDADEGARSADGRVEGTYLHGLFQSDAFRAAWLRSLGAAPGTGGYEATVGRTLDALAAHLETHLDIDAVIDIARRRQPAGAAAGG